MIYIDNVLCMFFYDLFEMYNEYGHYHFAIMHSPLLSSELVTMFSSSATRLSRGLNATSQLCDS